MSARVPQRLVTSCDLEAAQEARGWPPCALAGRILRENEYRSRICLLPAATLGQARADECQRCPLPIGEQFARKDREVMLWLERNPDAPSEDMETLLGEVGILREQFRAAIERLKEGQDG